MFNKKTMKQPFGIINRSSEKEIDAQAQLISLFQSCPIPQEEMLSNLGLFLRRRDLRRILFMNELYKHVVDIHGVIVEFGTRWGQNLSLFESFRGIYEPYNYNRKIIGFDTFAGFPSVHNKDGHSEMISVNGHGVTDNYEEYLQQILDCREQENPISNIKKYELIKGDASEQIEQYLKQHPETIIALAYFDFDLYEPTKKCLELISDHITKGSVIGFDELNFQDFPGETIALKEVLGLSKYKITRNQYSAMQSYIIID